MQRIIYDLQPAHCAVKKENLEADTPDVLTLTSNPEALDPESFYIPQARVIITQDYVIVAADDPSGPKVVFRERYRTFSKSNKDTIDSRIQTISGKILAFQRDTTCGCGSRLKSWNPYNYLENLDN